MPRLAPETSIDLGAGVSRLLLTLAGRGSDGAELRSTGQLSLVPKMGGRYVLETRSSGVGEISLHARDGHGSVSGAVHLGLRVIPSEASWELTDIRALGKAQTPLLRVEVGEAGQVRLTSLIPDVPDHETFRTAIVVDSSASMAWSYAEGGLLGIVLDALLDTVNEAIGSDAATTWFTFGARLETDWLVPRDVSSALTPVAGLRPKLFSSGAGIPWEGIGAIQSDWVVCITDTVGDTDGVREGAPVHVVQLGMDPEGLLPREQLAAQDRLREARIPLLTVSAGASADKVRSQVQRWALERLKQL